MSNSSPSNNESGTDDSTLLQRVISVFLLRLKQATILTLVIAVILGALLYLKVETVVTILVSCFVLSFVTAPLSFAIFLLRRHISDKFSWEVSTISKYSRTVFWVSNVIVLGVTFLVALSYAFGMSSVWNVVLLLSFEILFAVLVGGAIIASLKYFVDLWPPSTVREELLEL